MTRVFFDSNHFKASSPRALVDLLEDRGVFSRVIFHRNSKYVPRPTDLLIHWGNPPPRRWPVVPKTLNLNVSVAMNKLDAFEAFKVNKIRSPAFTTDYDKAALWAPESSLVGRSLLRAYEGRGIAISERGEAPRRQDEDGRRVQLWSKYVPKRKEFRVHVFNGKAIDITQKKKKHGVEADPKIRSWKRGWIFAREDIVKPAGIDELAVNAVKACGLDFGAVDIVWNERKDRCYVLEVNTAPGLDGQTLHHYANAIQEYINAV